MSKPLLLLVALCSAAAGSLRAQDSLLARLRLRADSLLITWRQSQALANLADSIEHERATAGRDTIAVGSLRIIANASPLPLREAAIQVWPAIDSLYGAAAADLAQRPYFIRAVDPDSGVRRTMLHVGLELPWDLDVQSTGRVLLMGVPMAPFDRALADWLGGPLHPAASPGDERAAVFVQLVTAPSQTVRRCFLGDLASCTNALQLGDTTGLLERWYATAEERRTLVIESFELYFGRGTTAAQLRSCVAHNDAVCTTLLRALPPGTLPRPLSNGARVALMREALRLGGRDAYRRLIANPAAPVAARLAEAAQMPVDSLVVAWRRAILDARPTAVALPWWASVTACGWTAFFAVCALRSSRWRR